jgi:hypothetical protein
LDLLRVQLEARVDEEALLRRRVEQRGGGGEEKAMTLIQFPTL